MNFFILDYDPHLAAKYHCDGHVNKMTTECYQMLGSALRRYGATDHQMPLTKAGTPLIGGYKYHPATKWCGNSRDNFEWACELGLHLATQFRIRFGHEHFCHKKIAHMYEMSCLIPAGRMTPFALAMPDEYINCDAVQSYREYYHRDKRYSMKNNPGFVWERGVDKPRWLVKMEYEYA
jgi:hypothetical protein